MRGGCCGVVWRKIESMSSAALNPDEKVCSLSRYAAVGCAALVLPLSLASCEAENLGKASTEKSGEFPRLETGVASMHDSTAVDRNSLRNLESNELKTFFFGKKLKISPLEKISSITFNEYFHSDGTWRLDKYGILLKRYHGTWRIEHNKLVVYVDGIGIISRYIYSNRDGVIFFEDALPDKNIKSDDKIPISMEEF
jgi:hypothetical protein